LPQKHSPSPEAQKMTDKTDYPKQAELFLKWLSTWDKIGQRILDLPEWMQTILLDDINTAVNNRIATMELILNAQRNS
jgi:hypothetical protein